MTAEPAFDRPSRGWRTQVVRRLTVIAMTLLAAGIVWWNEQVPPPQGPMAPESEALQSDATQSDATQTADGQLEMTPSGENPERRTPPVTTSDSTTVVESETPTTNSRPDRASRPAATTPSAVARKNPAPGSPEESRAHVVRNITVRDQARRVVYQGDVDLQPTLDRIARGEQHSHRNDGGVFRNLEQRLPNRPNGYYREYVHPTPGLSGPGPQRIVMGQQGEIYYTFDHYQTFRKIPE